MYSNLTFEQKTSESGSSKAPIYGALFLTIFCTALTFTVPDSGLTSALSAVSAGLTVTVLTLCACIQRRS